MVPKLIVGLTTVVPKPKFWVVVVAVVVVSPPWAIVFVVGPYIAFNTVWGAFIVGIKK